MHGGSLCAFGTCAGGSGAAIFYGGAGPRSGLRPFSGGTSPGGVHAQERGTAGEPPGGGTEAAGGADGVSG